MRIVLFGECMLEHSDSGEFRFGGDTLNTALYLSRMLPPGKVQVRYATGLGTDTDSDALIEAWQHEGLDTSLVLRLADKLPGRYQIHLNTDGQRRFEYWRDDSAAKHYLRDAGNPLLDTLKHQGCDYFYLSGISLAILSSSHRQMLLDTMARFCQEGGKVIFDNNYRPILWQQNPLPWYQKVMQMAYLVLLTDEDEYALYGGDDPDSILTRCQNWGIPNVLIKRGSQPCLIRTRRELTQVSGLKVEKVVDTSAAGDSFAAGFLASWLCGEPTDVAAKTGHALAARVIQYPGAIIPRSAMLDLMPIKE
ncbi:sugar kinase [Bowmanella yangjiangensis]|uniref:Sugar kinase n=1 Tax=Bowmanella yangjiangensis TaxID=2811230 RepID=A0ABS3CWS9_9ALTE|nr:sugar kinase [Bowmanella yangjiangensis]MBN7821587.1 sugar kinase [Bowmanella yangjiangensis]